MSDLIPDSKKGVAIYRVGIGVCTLVGTLLITAIFGYVKSADAKLSTTMNDVAQIKWELPVIKSTIAADKLEVQKRIETIDSKIENLRNTGDERSKEITQLRVEQAVLKQRLQMP